MMPIRVTKTIWALVGLSLFSFVLQKLLERFLETDIIAFMGLIPQLVVHGAIWQLVTYMFFHADVGHLVLNLLMLTFIGSELESVWGRWRFLVFYFFCGLVAALTYVFLQLVFAQSSVPMIGSSGGIYGLLIAYGILYGERVLLFMMLFPMKAKYFIWVLAGVEFFTGLFSSASGAVWGSVAHLGGMAGGALYLYGRGWYLVQKKQRLGAPGRRTKDFRKSHLKLVTGQRPDPSSKAKEDDEPRTWH